MRTITVEEHFISPGFIAKSGAEFTARVRHGHGARIFEQLQDVGARRIAEMDAAGIDMQAGLLTLRTWARRRAFARPAWSLSLLDLFDGRPHIHEACANAR